MKFSFASALKVFAVLMLGFGTTAAGTGYISTEIFFSLVAIVFTSWVLYNLISIGLTLRQSKKQAKEVQELSKRIIEREISSSDSSNSSLLLKVQEKSKVREKVKKRKTRSSPLNRILVDDERKIHERFWDGFRNGFLVSFTIIFVLFVILVISRIDIMTISHWQSIYKMPVIPAMVGTAIGLYFGLIRVLKINTGNFWLGKILFISAFIFVLLMLGALGRLFNEIQQWIT